MSFLKKKRDMSKRFTGLTDGATEEEKREGEQNLLKPEPIIPYTGEVPLYRSELDGRSALIVFKDGDQRDLVGEIFAMRTSEGKKDTYITDISLLDTLAKVVKKLVDAKMKEEVKKLDEYVEAEVHKRVQKELGKAHKETEESMKHGLADKLQDGLADELQEFEDGASITLTGTLEEVPPVPTRRQRKRVL